MKKNFGQQAGASAIRVDNVKDEALSVEEKGKKATDANGAKNKVGTPITSHPLKKPLSTYLQATKSSSQKCIVTTSKRELFPKVKKSISVHDGTDKLEPLNNRVHVKKTTIVREYKPREPNFLSLRSTVAPRLISLILRGPSRPRPIIKFLLNTKSIYSFDQLLGEMTKRTKPIWGSIRKVYKLDGTQVKSMPDLCDDKKAFFVAPTYMKHHEFILDSKELVILKIPVDIPEIVTKIPEEPVTLDVELTIEVDSVLNSTPMSDFDYSDSGSSYKTAPEYISPNQPLRMYHDKQDYDRAVTDWFDVREIVKEGNGYITRLCLDKINDEKYEVKLINVALLCTAKANEDDVPPDQDFFLLKQLRHPNIIAIFDDIRRQDYLYALVEHAQKGTLRQLINREFFLLPEECCSIVRDVASALEYLHSRNIVHRDINPENLLYCLTEGGEGIIKLSSFDKAIEVTSTSSRLYGQYGSFSYKAPEMLAETGYGMPVDMWSLGVILYEITCGELPFAASSQTEMSDLINSRKRKDWDPEKWDHIGRNGQTFILRILDADYKTRYCATDILEDEYLVVNAGTRKTSQAITNRFYRQGAFDFRIFGNMGLSNHGVPYGGFLTAEESAIKETKY